MPPTTHAQLGQTSTPRSTQPLDADFSLLLRRAGFGGTPDEVAAATAAGLQATVDRLVNYESIADAFTPPASSLLTVYKAQGNIAADLDALTVWWLRRMLTTTRPLQEKMVLFWHGHFATGIQKVRSTGLMFAQNQLFRNMALARFDDILTGVYKDPAMLVWLDGRQNTKASPNENWGREVLELFALGHGNFTEDDVHANSRAFTGWRLDLNGQVQFSPRLHDDGPKTLLGTTGDWTSDDAVRIIAAHRATGPFLATKLWRFFASDSPPSTVVTTLADVYYRSDHSIREMVHTLFTMPEFYTPEVRGGHIKSPVEFVLTPLRQFGILNADLTSYPRLLAFLGQQLFNPPNVGGWSGGPSWMNAATMLGRFNYASSLTGDTARPLPTAVTPEALGVDLSARNTSRSPRPYEDADALIASVVSRLGMTPGAATLSALRNFVGKSAVATVDLPMKLQGLVHLALVSPEYQAS